MAPGQILIDDGPFLEISAIVSRGNLFVGLAQVSQNRDALCDFEVVMDEGGDSAHRIDGQKSGFLLFHSEQVDGDELAGDFADID